MPDLKPELSAKNQYWISKHRYYELKHYCLQYPHWKELYAKLQFKMEAHKDHEVHGSNPGNPTEKYALIMAECKNAMELVERCCREACKDEPVISLHLLAGITKGFSYQELKSRYDTPCGKDMYYISHDPDMQKLYALTSSDALMNCVKSIIACKACLSCASKHLEWNDDVRTQLVDRVIFDLQRQKNLGML